MARRPKRNEPIVLNIDDIAFVVIATEQNLSFWKKIPPNEEAKPHIKILEESIVKLNALKARRDAGEDVEEERKLLLNENADSTMALNRIGPKALEDALVSWGIIPNAMRSI